MEGFLFITFLFICVFCPIYLASELLDTIWSAITFLFPYACFCVLGFFISIFVFSLLKGSKLKKVFVSILVFFLVFTISASLFTTKGAIRAGVFFNTGDIKTALTLKMRVRDASSYEVDLSALGSGEKAYHLKGCPVKRVTKGGSSLDNWAVRKHCLILHTAHYIEDSSEYKRRKQLWTLKHSGSNTVRICRAHESFVVPGYETRVNVSSVCVLEESGDLTLLTVLPRENDQSPEIFSLSRTSPKNTTTGQSMPWLQYFPLTETNDDNTEDTGIVIKKTLYEALLPGWIESHRRYSRIVKDIEAIREL